MSLPTDLDYQEAIQNPRGAFGDQELQGGQPELLSPALPLPKARTGNFAVAFRMNCGSRAWAVKCFTRALHADLQSRYMEIGKHLELTRTPYAVGFTFLPLGIRVKSQWYPILKMEWIEGELLAKYIERHLGNRAALVTLATKWLEMVRALHDAGIEHGDLQHGNVVVVGGNLRLIDYDGMFVPSLAGRLSHEKGHQNYQHPLRDAEFGPGLDNFSAWVVFLSILAVAHDPQLWTRFNGGDDCLLLRRRDFTDPDNSKVIQALLGAREQRLQSVASLFRNLVFMAPQQVPSLDGQFVPGPAQPAPQGMHGWISDHLDRADSPRLSPTGAPAARAEGTQADMSSWMLDFVGTAPQAQARFSSVPDRERVVAGVSMMFSGMVALGVMNGRAPTLFLACLPAIVLANVVYWLIRYRQDSAVEEREERMLRLADADNDVAQAEARVRALEVERRRSDALSAEEPSTFRKRHEAIAKRQSAELETPRREYQAEMARLQALRSDIDQRETARLRQIQNDSGAKLVSLTQQIAASMQSESTELAKALALLQQEVFDSTLRMATLDRADIPGVKDALKANLRAHGIHSAAEANRISYVKVRGIGDQKRASILVWRQHVEAQARARMPTSLPAGSALGIQSAHRSHRGALEGERDRTQQQNANERRAAQGQAAGERQALVTGEAVANDKLGRAEAAVVARYAPEFASCAADAAAAAAAARARSHDFDRRMQEMRKATFGVKWKRERARREAAAFDAVRFRNYVRRIVPGLSA